MFGARPGTTACYRQRPSRQPVRACPVRQHQGGAKRSAAGDGDSRPPGGQHSWTSIETGFHFQYRKQQPSCQNTEHKNNVYCGKEEMNRTASTLPCPCHRTGTHASYTDELDIGLTGDGWDITRSTCTRCGTTWLHAYRADEMFPRAGRYFRAPLEKAQLEKLTPASALNMIGSSRLLLAGGSRHSHVECRIEGPLRRLTTA